MKKFLKISILALFGLVWFNGYSANATDYSSPVIKKALLTGVEQCYKNGLISTSAGKISDFSSFGSLILSGDNSHYIGLPSGLTGIKDDDVSCEELFMGYNSFGGNFEGVFALSGHNGRPTSSSGKIELLEGMGYEKVESDTTENERRINFTYNQTLSKATSQVETDTIVATLDSEGIITNLAIEYTGNYAMQPSDGSGGSAFFIVADGKIRLARATTPPRYSGMMPTYYDTSRGIGDPWDGDDGFLADLRSTVSRRGDFSYTFSVHGASLLYQYSLPGGSTAGNYNPSAIGNDSYEIPFGDIYGPTLPDTGINKATNSAIQYLSGIYNNVDDLKFSDAEKIALLTASLKNYFFKDKSTSEYWVCDVTDWADYGSYLPEYEIHVAPDGSIKRNCRLDISQLTQDGVIHGFSGDRFDVSGSAELTLSETIAEINRLVGELPEDAESVVPPTPTDPGAEGGSAATCYNSTSLGWILCAGIDLVGGVTKWAYDYIVNNFLVVDASFVGNPNTVDAWKIFQRFANIIFVILFIIVIFSQLTGIGLNNYGVKKALPKLIMVAVLVNLSYILCSVAIDLSNILGESLQLTFEELANSFETVDAFNFSNVIGDVLSFLLTGAGIGLIAFGAFNWQLWLPVFAITLLGMVLSIMFFFIILAVRQAGVIILLVLAPVAVVCYALPNTKNVFERWKKMFISLLLVYPICGALIGGGTFASTLLLAASGDHQGFFYNLVAMLIQVIPFFFIPYVLKSSMIAMGNIGNRIGNFGNRLGKKTTGLARNSESFKEAQAQLRKNNAERYLRKNDWRKRHRVLGAPGRAMGAVGAKIRSQSGKGGVVGGIGRFATDMYNQKQARKVNAALNARASNQSAGYLANSDFDKLAERNANAIYRRHINDLSKDWKDAHADVATDEAALMELHQRALSDLENNFTDENLAAVEAAQDMLAISDGGRLAVFDNLAEAAKRGDTRSLELGAQHMLREHTRDIKPNNRDMFSFLNAAAKVRSSPDGLHRDSFRTYTDDKGKEHFVSNHFAQAGIDGYDAASFAKIDEGSINRLIEEAGTFDNVGKTQLEELTRVAMTSPNIHVQQKMKDKFNRLREVMGYQRIDDNHDADVGQAQNQNRNSQQRSDSGTINLRQDNTPPDGWTENDNRIILPHDNNPNGHISDTDLHELANQARQRQRRQGSTGGQRQSRDTIIMPHNWHGPNSQS